MLYDGSPQLQFDLIQVCADSLVRATEKVEKGNVMFIVGRTQVNCKKVFIY